MNSEAPQTCRIPATGITLAYVSRGSGPLVIFLHGFPDTYCGFLPILDRVAAAGYRAVALAMRGYAPSALAPGGDYRIEALAGDVIGLADALGAEQFAVVGHDWGAVTAYAAAHLAPQRVTRLVTAAVPHTGHFLLRMRWQQLRRSSYMLRFQLPWFPEWEIPRDDYRWLEQLIARWSPGWAFGDTELRPLKQNFDEPGRLKAALSYYRQLSGSLISPASRRLVFPAVTVPTRMIYGGRDGCIAPAMFQGQKPHFTAGLDLVAMPDAGHFMQWEQAGRFADLVVGFLM
ncbi:alpha/beta fold hydrolase [Hydrocarboniphaga sp.]|uniref:alpha/beta fold hydrolase n=1 Tax=Hydrocarboniphaga sp. TaxID=2033016 RepID=UPI003D09869D